MSFLAPFPKELAQYLADNSGGHFSLSTNLKIGELVRGVEGTYVLAGASMPPEVNSPIEYHTIEFWSVNDNSATGYDDLQYVYNLFHQRYATETPQFQTTSFYVYASEAISQIEDMDRDSEGRKIWRLSIDFVVQNLIS